MKLWWDLETFCETPISEGTHKYAEKAEIMLFAWAVDDGPVEVWDFTRDVDSFPPIFLRLNDFDEYWGHNSGMFDRTIVKRHDYGWLWPLAVEDHKHRDTMVQALCHGLPGSLSALCEIFRLPVDLSKDKRGRQLIHLFCKPRPKNSKLRRATRETHPQEWEEFKEYARSDIRSMRELHKKMPKWNYPNNDSELALWQLDQQINQEGVYVDLELASSAVAAVEAAQSALANRTHEATNGVVSAATQRDALLAYILTEHGVSLPDMRADTLERRLADTSLPQSVRDLIAIRLESSTSSVSKYKHVLAATNTDGFLRGIIQFSGAGRTGRDAGRLFQPQNLLRPTLLAEDIAFGIEAIKAGVPELFTDNVMELCANTMRGVIIAPPGKKMVVADLSNIEGRVLAWLAGEAWKLQAFRDFDAGIGHDLYKLAYARAFRCKPEEVDKTMRQIGKVMELFLGYEGGVGAFITGAATYGIDLDSIDADIPGDVWHEAEGFREWSIEQKRPLYDLSHRTFCMLDSIKRLWRRAHLKTQTLWGELKDAYAGAVNMPGDEVHVGHLSLWKQGNWLRIELPSGRSLSYASPRAEDGKCSYRGINQYSRKWSRLSTYGGKLAENVTQAVARDVFKNCYQATIDAGYSPRIPVHDELICYAPDTDEYSAEGLSEIMSRVPPWAKGLPIAAAGFEGYRYKKD
jgi:DNA polymerase bacteriophage-type